MPGSGVRVAGSDTELGLFPVCHVQSYLMQVTTMQPQPVRVGM